MVEKEAKKKIIGERIKVIRKELGLTMNDFGKKFNPPASDSIVSRWERGISSPNNERLKKIAELGSISMFYLTTGKKAISDLSIEEKKNAAKELQVISDKIKDDQKEYLKKEFDNIKIDELNFVSVTFLTEALSYLKWSDETDVISLASILFVLNNSTEIKKDGSVNRDELKEYVRSELKDIKEFVERRFSIEENVSLEGFYVEEDKRQ